MGKYSFIIMSLVFFAVSAFSEARVIELKNGQVINGEIVRDENGELTVKLDQYGEMTVNKEDVKLESLYSDGYKMAEEDFSRGRFVEAIKAYHELLQNPDPLISSDRIISKIGDCYLRLDKPDKAVVFYTKVMGETGDNSLKLHCSIRADYCRLRAGEVQPLQVDSYKNRKKSIGKDDMAFYCYIEGRRLQAEKKYEEAAMELLSIDVLYPETAGLVTESKMLAAECFGRIGKQEFAKSLYKEIYGNSPSSEEGKEAYKRMNNL
ncbi:MAG: hypothetical protein JW728_00100 [Candidatus Aureabacteria bacterium]|nr:hypothetical protein [Candidatus Auribacterota bacterium]